MNFPKPFILIASAFLRFMMAAHSNAVATAAGCIKAEQSGKAIYKLLPGPTWQELNSGSL